MFGYTDVEPSQLKQLLTNQDVMLVDVRTPTESARASIPGAHNIPLHLLPLRKQDLPDDRTVVFYCQSGNRSAQACAFMIGQGWRNVCNPSATAPGVALPPPSMASCVAGSSVGCSTGSRWRRRQIEIRTAREAVFELPDCVRMRDARGPAAAGAGLASIGTATGTSMYRGLVSDAGFNFENRNCLEEIWLTKNLMHAA